MMQMANTIAMKVVMSGEEMCERLLVHRNKAVSAGLVHLVQDARHCG